jgi:CspA family cold shock protein
MQGTVKWFDATKRFGFIAAADGSADLLVESEHILDQYRNSISESCQVDFEVFVGMKGPQAHKVRLAHTRVPPSVRGLARSSCS